MKTKSALRFPDLPKDYAALCHLLMPRPIHDTVEYLNVAEMTDAMALWQDNFTADQRDYFELLCGLLGEYDRVQVRWPNVSVQARLEHLLEEADLSAADLSRLLGGSRNLGSMILRGERNLTLAHVRKLSEHFHVSPELFI